MANMFYCLLLIDVSGNIVINTCFLCCFSPILICLFCFDSNRMAVPEFLQRFQVIWLAHIGPDDWALETGLHSRTPWRAALAFRQWRAGFNAGGPHKCIGKCGTSKQNQYFPCTFWTVL